MKIGWNGTERRGGKPTGGARIFLRKDARTQRSERVEAQGDSGVVAGGALESSSGAILRRVFRACIRMWA